MIQATFEVQQREKSAFIVTSINNIIVPCFVMLEGFLMLELFGH